jgi:tripartite-type tricarboxylate transporter receptor subunit TctC
MFAIAAFRFLIAIALVATSSVAVGQAYPTKPITIIVPFSAGGTGDIVARTVAQKLSDTLGKPVIVDNRPGGGGVIGWNAVANAAPDGYTLLATDTSYAMAAALIPKLPFDARKDFVHVATTASVPFIMVVNPDVPAKNVKEFIALAKAQPGKLHYGSGGNGTSSHLAGEWFKDLAGVDIAHVPYKGGAAAIQDLIGGHVQVSFPAVASAMPGIKAGKLRALMVTADKRVPALPDVSSAPEAGLPTMIGVNWFGISAPAKTPPDVLDRLHKAILVALASPEVKDRLAGAGVDPVGNTPAQASAFVNDEIQRWSALVKSASIKPE